MKNLNIHSFGLVMMMVMVYAEARPLNRTHDNTTRLLIRDEADRLLKSGEWNKTHHLVPKISLGSRTCVDKFFCLAEESLKAQPNWKKLNNSRLTHLLHTYNKEQNATDCHLNHNATYHVVRLLVEILTCARQ